MTFKRLLVLGGAALLVAGCSSDLTTSPTAVNNDAHVARPPKKPLKRTPGGVIMSVEQSDSTSCAHWPIVSGAVGDSTCVVEPSNLRK